MKLLKLVSSLQDANNISLQLKSRGILTFIANEETKNLYPHMGIIRTGVWIILDYQYEDAVQILNNPDHIVSQPLTPGEMALMSKEIRKPYSQISKSMIRLTAMIFFAVALLCVISYVVRTTT